MVGFPPIVNFNKSFDNNELIMWIDLSTYCNAKCPQCHRTNPNGLEKIDWLPLKQWSLEDFKKAFPKQILNKIRRFDFCGTWGDPILNKDILKIVEYIVDNSFLPWVQINTNGSVRSEEWWWELGKVGDSRLIVVFDIDGVTQEQHSLYRQNTNLEKILNNMESFSNTKAKATAFSVIFKHNRKSMYDIALLSKRRGATGITFIESDRFFKLDDPPGTGEKGYIPTKDFIFVDRSGQKQKLQPSKFKATGKSEKGSHRQANDFFWVWWDLSNDEHLEKIRHASN